MPPRSHQMPAARKEGDVDVKKEPRPYLTPNEVAGILMVSPVTVRQWAQKGLLKAELTLGGHRRFLRTEVERFVRENGLALQPTVAAGVDRLLVVDDDRQLAGYIQELLSEIEGLGIELAFDGYEAGIKVARFRPHLVLMDLMMPGLDGFEVCRRIKTDESTRHIRVITMTGFRTSENVGKALAAGAEQCLPKPLDAAALLALVRRAS